MVDFLAPVEPEQVMLLPSAKFFEEPTVLSHSFDVASVVVLCSRIGLLYDACRVADCHYNFG